MKSQELANGEKSCNGKKQVEEASPMEWKVKAGDIIWVKNRGGLWWPAQVAESIKEKRSARKVLVRQYGTYTYSYVDPNKWLSEFKTVLKQNNGSYRDIFAKSLEQDVARLKNGGSRKQKSKPEGNKEDKSQQSKKSTAETKSKPNGKHAKEDASKKKSKKKEKRKTREGSESIEEGSGNLTPKPSEALQKRKLNDSSPMSEKMSCSRTQELSARRIRVMQSLGLAAPTGSPFRRNMSSLSTGLVGTRLRRTF